MLCYGRRGKRALLYSYHLLISKNINTSTSTCASEPRHILLVAAVITALSETGGTRNLDNNLIPVSDTLVLQVLKRSSLDVSKKLDFFKWCSLNPDYKHSAYAYTQILKSICHCGNDHHHEIINLLISMKREGLVLDSRTFNLLLDTFIRLGKYEFALEILDHMEEELVGTASCFNADVYNSVLIALIRKEQRDVALSIFFKFLESSNNNDGNSIFIPDSNVCNELLVSLRKADMKIEFRKVFDKLREKKRMALDLWGYNICIHAFGCWGEPSMSLSLFREMRENDPSPDLCTYNSLIHVLCLVGKVRDAIMVWEELKISGHEPDAFTYRIIIQGCCKSCKIDDARKIFSEMQYNGFRPDTVVYNSVLDGLFKARRVLEACQLFEKMVDDGVGSSIWTYNILIDGLIKNGRAAAGYTLFCDLKKKGQFVDGVMYSIMILCLCRENQLDEAFQLVEEMEERGLFVDLVTITSLLIGLYREGQWNRGDKLMKHIRDGYLVLNVLKWKSGLEASLSSPQSRKKDSVPIFPSRGSFIEIMNVMSSQQDEEFPSHDTDPWSSSPYMDWLANKANFNDHYFQKYVVSRGRRVKAKKLDSFDIDMVNTYLSIFLAKGKLSLACKIFEIFTDMGVDPVSYTYNSMMSSFVKKGYFNEAWGVFREMGESLCPLDIATYNVIIQSLGKMGKADLASAVLDKLVREGGYLDIMMYNTLINALGKAGRLDEAKKFFNQMRASGINADVVTYNTLIEIHSKAGQVEGAYKFLKMMLDAGVPPNHVTDTTLEFLERMKYKNASTQTKNKFSY